MKERAINGRLKKLKGRSLDELRVRVAQALAAGAERRGWSRRARVPGDAAFAKLFDASRVAGGAASAEGLLAHFRARREPRFFAAFADREATLAAWRARFGAEAEARLVERARRITEGRFDLLGLSDLGFGAPPDWHLEPVAGKRVPLAHWSRIDELDARLSGDKKIIWELNRHQHFVVLGRAYWVTGDERYAEAFVEHLMSWADANPPKLGVNWVSSLEVALRAVSWLWALYFFKDSARLTPAVFLRALKLLYLHARHVETYLSTYSSPNTHLTGEALGLYYVGLLLPEFARAPRWREKGERILLAELDRHVRPDGVYFEQTSYYHRYTVDFYTHLCVLTEANGGRAGAELRAALAALLDHLMYVSRPDGTTPFYGDDDGGKLLKFDDRAAADFRPALSTGAALLGRADYKFVAGEAAEETLWLLGPEGLRAFDALPAEEPARSSRAFADGGYYVMRDGWRRDADYLLIDCGPHGTHNCGHAHADALAFELAARGRTLLVDPGTYTYTGSAELRDLFRSTAAHNTLTVDGESSSVPAGPFSWSHVARCRAGAWAAHPRFDFFAGTHDGYARLADPVAHERAVLFVKGSYWVVRDRAAAAGAHRYDLRFHFAPDARPSDETDAGGAAVAREGGDRGPGLEMFTFGPGGAWRREEGWVSGCYGERRAAAVLNYSAAGEGAQEFVTFLVPLGAGGPRARVREIGGAGLRAYEVTRGGERDLLSLGGGLAGHARLETDFEWAWARLDRETDEPRELILIGGRRASLNGRVIVSAAERLTYVYARREGDGLRVESELGVGLLVPGVFVGSGASSHEVNASV